MVRLGLLILFGCLPLGTAALEVGTGVSLGLALLFGDRRALPLLAPALGVAVWLLASALGHGRDAWIEAFGRMWALAPLISVPMLMAALDPEAREQAARVGLAAACFAALIAIGQVTVHAWELGQGPWSMTVPGPFSHHLTLGYALLMPLSAALVRGRLGVALWIGLGVLSAGASGPLLSLALLLLAWRLRPPLVLLGGIGLALCLIALLALRGDHELHERALLWATGQTLTVEHPLGVGPLGFREAAATVQDRMEAGYFFPLHAHDSLLQIGAMGGFGGLVAWGWLLHALWGQSGRAGRACLVALLVGGLTQDTLGDLEVIRALLAWALLDTALPNGAAPLPIRPSENLSPMPVVQAP